MRIQLFLVLSSVGLALGQIGNADSYLDEVLNNARNDPAVRGKLDPLRIPDFSDKKLRASGIRVFGLLNLVRTGPATISDLGNGNFAIEVNVGLNQVKAEARYRYRLAFFRVKGRVYAKADSITCNVRIAVQDGRAILQNFSLGEMRGLKVTKATGLVPGLQWLPKMLAEKALKKNRGKLRNEIESGAREAITRALERVNIDRLIPRN